MNNFVERYCRFNEIVNAYSDIAEPCATDLLGEHGLTENGSELAETIDFLKTEGRSLNIGIIGRVKAGKSSLLNSLFFGDKDILPKAATPMTAALTVITYGDKPQAEITYYSSTDIAEIRENYEKYNRSYDELCRKLLEEPKYKGDVKKVQHKVRNELKSNQRLDASHAQYSSMIDSGLLPEFSSDHGPEIITAENPNILMNILKERVGSSGRYMPFTKSVKLMLNIDELKDLEIVDTPGLDDPIVSRSKRTEEYLSKAEVVFIVSPAATFLSQEDFNLMDRLSGVKGEGIRELFLISSMGDNQLYGPEVIEQSGGILFNAIEYVKNVNAEHAVSIFKNIDDGAMMQYGQLAEDTLSRLYSTSAMAGKMLASYSDKDSWDDEIKHNFSLMQSNYENSFGDDASTRASLTMLSGIDTIRSKISEIRQRKSEIQIRKCQDLLSGRENAFNAVLKDLKSAITARKYKLETISIKDIVSKREELQRIRNIASDMIDNAFTYSVKTLVSDMRGVLNRSRSELMSKVRHDAENEKGTETRTSSYTTGWWIFKKRHYTSYEVEIIRAGSVKGILDNLIYDLSNELLSATYESYGKWRQLLQAEIVQAVQDSIPQNFDSTVITAEDIRMAINRQVRSFNIEVPDLTVLSYRKLSPNIENFSGKLEGHQGDCFIDTVQDYLNKVGNCYNQYINQYLTDLERVLGAESVSEMIFRNLDRTVAEFGEQLKNKEDVLKRIVLLEKELNTI